jgi:mediator of RNA polymerase II transcription subunit 18
VSYFIDSIEISLVRYYHLPTAAYDPSRGAQPLPSPLPPFESLHLLDPSGTWLLFVRTTVVEDNSPEKTKKALEELYAVRDRLAGVFDFKIVDRRAHDTRILQPMNAAPAPMPQTQRVRG